MDQMNAQNTMPQGVQPAPQPVPPVQTPAPKAPKSGPSALIIILISCVVILVIAFIALGVLGYLAKKAIEKSGPKITEQLIEKGLEKGIGENVDLNLDKGNFEIKGDEGSFSASDKLPDDFPKDVPLYTGAKITSSITAKGTDDKSSSVTVSLTTKDSVDKVSAFYAAELKDNSWVVDSDYTTEEGYALSASKDGRSLFVTASGNSGETSITVSVVTE